MKFSRGGIIIAFIAIMGVFSPWIGRELDPVGQKNPSTGQGELVYEKKILLSPFYLVTIQDKVISNVVWFISSGTTVSGLLLLIASSLFVIKFKNSLITTLAFFLDFIGIIIFFMSLGTGLSIGLRTYFEFGLWITLIGVGSMFIFSIRELSRDPKWWIR